jgi:uncharacterized RDD family membrane protein YckC
VEADASVCALWVFLLYSFTIIRADVEEAWGTHRLARGIYPKADILNRVIAKFVDAILVIAAGKLLSPAGWLAGLAYILIGDGFSGGRSIGKRITGLQTVNVQTQDVAGFKESIIRNLPLASAYLMFSVPYVGWIAAGAIMAFEALLMLGNERGLRLGDELAHTQVLQSGQLDVRE